MNGLRNKLGTGCFTHPWTVGAFCRYKDSDMFGPCPMATKALTHWDCSKKCEDFRYRCLESCSHEFTCWFSLLWNLGITQLSQNNCLTIQVTIQHSWSLRLCARFSASGSCKDMTIRRCCKGVFQLLKGWCGEFPCLMRLQILEVIDRVLCWCR